jgi:hypothetical protein
MLKSLLKKLKLIFKIKKKINISNIENEATKGVLYL